MAASQQQKVDFLLKKIGYTASKTGLAEDSSLSGTKKAPFAEAVPSPLVIASTCLWADSTYIPATPPGSDSDYVKVYLSAASGHRMTVDSTVSGNRAYIAYSTYNDNGTAILGDWIDTQFGASYIIKVYKGDPNSGGVQLSAAGSGSNDGWFFDYSAGILNFNDTNVPSGVTDSNIYVVGYRYIGTKGPTAAGGISTFTTQYVSGVSTFADDVNLYGNAGVTSAFWDKSGDAVILNDNTKAAFGTGQDLEFFHDGANSTIKNTTGTLFVDNGGTTFRNVTGSETQLAITDNGSVAAYFDNAKKIETLSVGATVTGNLGATSVSISGISTFEGNVDANGTLDVDGQSELDDVNVSGVSTFGQLVSASAGANIAGTAGLNVVGVSTLGQLVTASAGLNVSGTAGLNVAGVTTVAGQIDGNAGADISGGETTLSSATVTDLTSGRLTVAGTSGALQDSSNLTFDGTNKLAVTGGLTVSAGATLSSNLDVDGGADISGGGGTTLNVVGHTELDRVNVSAAATFAGDIDANGNIDVDGRADLDDVVVTGVATFSNNIDADGNLDVDGRTDLDDVVVAGVATFSALVDGNAGANFSGAETTLSSATVSDLTDNRIVLAGTSGSLEDSSKITFDGSTLAIVGNATFTGNVSVAGTLTSEDKENIDSVGLITARTGVRITSGGLIVSSGVNTFTDAINANGGLNVNGDLELYGSTGVSSVTWDKSADYLKIKDNAKIVFGNTASSAIWRDGTDTLWANYQGHLTIRGGSSSSNIRIQAKSGDQSINAIKEGAVELYFDGSKKIETAQTGAIVTGVLTATSFSGTLDTAAQPNITSLGTIASLVASRSQVTGVGGFSVTGVSTFTGDIDANGNIDVDGRADLDDVVVTGVATFSNNIDANGDLDVDGHTELDYVNVSAAATFAGFIDANAGANVAGGFVANSAKISDLTSGRVPVVGTDGELEDASTFTFSGGTVTATGFSGNLTGTLQTAAQGNVTSVGTLTGLDVNGHTELDNIQVTGIATVANVVLTKNITGVGATIGGLNVGVVTYYGDGSQLTGIDATSLKDGAGNIKVQAVTTGAVVTGLITATTGFSGDITGVGATFTNVTGTLQTAAQGNVTSLGTLTGLTISGGDLNVVGENILLGNSASGSDDRIVFGSGGELNIYHNGTSSLIEANDLRLRNAAGDESFIVCTDDAAVDIYYDGTKRFATSGVGATVYGLLAVTGGVDISGGANTLNVTGHTELDNLNVSGIATIANVVLTKNTTGVGATVGGQNVGVVTYFGDGSKLTGTGSDSGGTQRVEVVNTGVILVGVITATDQFSGQITGVGATFTNITGLLATAAQTNITSLGNLTGLTINGDEEFYGSAGVTSAIWDKSENTLNFKDHVKATFGTTNDLRIYHNSSNSYIDDSSGTGALILKSNIYSFRNAADDEQIAKFNEGGTVDLYHNNIKRFSTFTEGIQVWGTEGGNAVIQLKADEGDDNDDQYRILAGDGTSLNIQNYASGSWETNIKATGNGNVELYWDNSKKIETTHHGAIVTGILTATGDIIAYEDSTGSVKLVDDGNIEITNNNGGLIDFKTSDSEDFDCRIRQQSNGLQFMTGGNGSADERLRIKSDGMVGIGTDDPNALLHVEKDGTSEVLARFESNMGTNNNRAVTLTSPTSDSASLPFTFATGNSFEFKCDTHIGLHIDDDGKIGINTNNPGNRLTVWANDSDADTDILSLRAPTGAFNIRVDDADAANPTWTIRTYATEPIAFGQGTTEIARFDGSGNLLIGHDASRAVGNVTSQMQLEALDASAGISITRNSNNASGPYVSLAKSRGGAVGGTTVIQADDAVGSILFSGADGTDITNNAASIVAYIDATPGGNDTPGRLTFNTTADGGTSPTERLRISADGTADFNSNTLQKAVLKNYTETVKAVGDTGTSATLDLADGNVFTATLTGNCTFTFTTGTNSAPNAASFTLILANDTTPSRTITWPAAVKWPNNSAPSRTTAASKTDIWTFMTPDNGTTWYGNIALYNFT